MIVGEVKPGLEAMIHLTLAGPTEQSVEIDAGCIREACSFRDNMEKFVDSGARVVGISADSVGTHRKFAKSFNLDYLLLSDPDRVVHQKFGISSSFFGLLSGRVTFVVGLDGVVKFALESQFQPLKHVYNSLKAVKELQEES